MSDWTRRRTRDNQAVHPLQLEWVAHIVQYVNYVHETVKIHGNAKSVNKTSKRTVDLSIPLLGPYFLPPSQFHTLQREAVPTIKPHIHYIRPLTVIHPLYFPHLLKCPECGSTNPKDVSWDQWTTTGYRDVHGLRREEVALGIQLRCTGCSDRLTPSGAKAARCFATTNHQFWEKWEHWQIPRKCSILMSKLKWAY